jgi:predicted enzyme related to lactoylglutathione lyase
MAKVTGLGGVFFKARDPDGLRAWYAEHLGIESESWGRTFEWRERDDPEKPGGTVWGIFRHDTDYFAPSEKPYMMNYRVDDLDGLLERLRAAGIRVDEKIEDSEFGRFGWFMDPEGTRVELWQPAPGL